MDRLPPRSHGLTDQLPNHVFCYLSREALALDIISAAKRTKGITSPGALVCRPGSHQRQAPSGQGEGDKPRASPLAGPQEQVQLRVWWDLPTPAWAWPVQGPGFYPQGSCVSDISCFQVQSDFCSQISPILNNSFIDQVVHGKTVSVVEQNFSSQPRNPFMLIPV